MPLLEKIIRHVADPHGGGASNRKQMNCYRLLDLSKRSLQTTKSDTIKHIRWCSDWKSLDSIQTLWFPLQPEQISIDNKYTTIMKKKAHLFFFERDWKHDARDWVTNTATWSQYGTGRGREGGQIVDLQRQRNAEKQGIRHAAIIKSKIYARIDRLTSEMVSTRTYLCHVEIVNYKKNFIMIVFNFLLVWTWDCDIHHS